MLSKEHWLEVIERAPLVSIDLIIRDPQGRVLLGYRNNEPAKGSWFVPGGVIRKNETLDQAFARIARTELDLHISRAQSTSRGIYEHHYAANFAERPGISTHYVVLPHEIRIEQQPAQAADNQHKALKAFTVTELLAHPQVHEYTKAYFRG